MDVLRLCRLNAAEVHIDENNDVYQGDYYVVNNGVMNGIPVLVKFLRDEDHHDAFMNEIRQLSRVRHPFILDFLGFIEEPLAIVFRNYPVSLRDLMNTNAMDMNYCFDMLCKLASVLQFVHSIEGLAVHDLRPETVFIDEGGNPKVCLMDLVSHEDLPRYKSPETLRHEPFNAACDVYTLGVMMWEMYLRQRPFMDVTNEEELMALQRNHPMLPVDDGALGDGRTPREIIDCASRCYSYNPEERPTVTALKQMIMDIGVRSVIHSSQSAGMFWKQVCSNTYCSHVHVGVFVNAVRRAVSTPERVITADAITEVLRLALPQLGPTISINEFWNLCCWFPSFFQRENCFVSMQAFVHNDCYCTDGDEALARFGRTDGDSFVIKPSTSDAFQSPFTICALIRGRISLYHITRRVEEDRLCFTSALTGETVFSSVQRLAKFIEEKMGVHVAHH